MTHTLAMRRRMVADRAAPERGLTGCGCAQVGEQVRHLERRAHGLRALADTRVGLVGTVEREHAEGDRDTRLDGSELKTRGGLGAT